MQEKLAKELEKIGLSDKEARVYLAALELGPSTAQQIAVKATVNRPSTYIAIESLIQRGLMSSFNKGKKRYFAAGEPTQLTYILDRKKLEIEKQQEALGGIIKLVSKMADQKDDDVVVQVFEGMEGTKVVQGYLEKNTDMTRELVPLEKVRKFFPPVFKGDIREKFIRDFPIRALSATNNPDLATDFSDIDAKDLESRTISLKEFPIEVSLLIFGDVVSILTLDDNFKNIVIHNKFIADTFKIIYDNLWEKGKVVHKSK